MLDQQRDVAGALAQRRQLDVDDAEAEEEVLAEAAALDVLAEVAVGGRDDARVERDRSRVPPTRVDALLLEHAQQLDLHLERHVADLVEQERAALGQLELARVAAACLAPVKAPAS